MCHALPWRLLLLGYIFFLRWIQSCWQFRTICRPNVRSSSGRLGSMLPRSGNERHEHSVRQTTAQPPPSTWSLSTAFQNVHGIRYCWKSKLLLTRSQSRSRPAQTTLTFFQQVAHASMKPIASLSENVVHCSKISLSIYSSFIVVSDSLLDTDPSPTKVLLQSARYYRYYSTNTGVNSIDYIPSLYQLWVHFKSTYIQLILGWFLRDWGLMTLMWLMRRLTAGLHKAAQLIQKWIFLFQTDKLIIWRTYQAEIRPVRHISCPVVLLM